MMKFEAITQFEALKSGVPGDLHVLLKLSAPPGGPGRNRINLVLVLDKSGSMRDSKIAAVKEAAKLILDRLGAQDSLSVVVYGTEVQPLLKPGSNADKDYAKRAIDSITTGGATNLSGGLLMGLKFADKARGRDSVTRVVLLTDGLANRGLTDPEKLAEIAGKHARKGIITSTLGFGDGFNEDFLTRVAQAGGGNFHYIRTADDVPGAFEKELGDALSVSAQNVVFTIMPAPGFETAEILNSCPWGREAGFVEVFAGDLFSGEARKLLARISFPSQEPGRRKVLSARAEFDSLEAGHERGRLDAEVCAEFSLRGASPPDEDVTLEIGLMKTAAARQKSMALADAGEFAKAGEVLLKAAAEVASHPLCARRLAAEILEMRRFAAAFAERQWGAGERKALSASVFLSKTGRLLSTNRGIVDTRVDEDE